VLNNSSAINWTGPGAWYGVSAAIVAGLTDGFATLFEARTTVAKGVGGTRKESSELEEVETVWTPAVRRCLLEGSLVPGVVGWGFSGAREAVNKDGIKCIDLDMKAQVVGCALITDEERARYICQNHRDCLLHLFLNGLCKG
jgi:hypothetical protein